MLQEEGQRVPQPDRTPARELRARDDAFDDGLDVPAAVVCAVCGDAACAGCEREMSRSGIVAMVAWERPGTPALGRLWSTARAATMTGEAFFERLPDGPLGPAFRFAVTVELIAAFGLVVTALPFVFLVAPDWMRHVALDVGARDVALRIGVMGVPSLALLLVAAHAAHGLALDHGARKAGARGARSRALRFGLYASGWDLVLGPMGAVILAFKEGIGSSVRMLGLGVGLPGRCTRAFLRGGYALEGERANRANRSASFAAVVSTIVGAVVILVGAVFVVLAID
jgi:hypothetical protein